MLSAIIKTMQQNKIITISEFTSLHFGLIKSYEINFSTLCPSLDEIKNIFFQNISEIHVDELLQISNNHKNVYLISFIKRLIGIREIIYCRDNSKYLEIPFVWQNIKESIETIPVEFTISSIGSQGFLSIPLYKNDKEIENFDFIRLHIWDDTLDALMDRDKNEMFSIHTHTFFARSWIITGKIVNNRFDYYNSQSNSTHSLFKVEYNDSLNHVNKHTSIAVNQNKDVAIKKVSEEIHYENSYYKIAAGKLHQSGHLDSPNASATFFSFTGKEGLGNSVVVGPKNIQSSEVNRKINIDPKSLLLKIDNQLK